MKDFNLNEEVIDNYTVTTDRKKVWQVELDLLKKIDEVCKKNNLSYFADAGTLLGAVRHKGFIPWDDDIDIVMFRDDYDKLVKISKKEFKKPYFFQCYKTEKNYGRGHAQLRNSDTTAILDIDKKYNLKINQGIFLDIFVLDGVPDNIKNFKKNEKRMELLNILINCKMYKSKKHGIKTYYLSKLLSLKLLIYIKEKILKKNSVDDCEKVAPLGFIYEIKKRIRNKSLYDDIVLLDFENTKIPAPKYYDDYLRQRYGEDYLTPKNVSNTHGDVFFDTEKSYINYIKKSGDKIE